MYTGALVRFRPCFQNIDQFVLQTQSRDRGAMRVFGFRIHADFTTVFLDNSARSLRISSNVGIWNWPSYWVERSARGCFARRVLICAKVKSAANQPSSAVPSTSIVRLYLANSGRVAMSVVSFRFGSWRAINTPSLVETKSGSKSPPPIQPHGCNPPV